MLQKVIIFLCYSSTWYYSYCTLSNIIFFLIYFSFFLGQQGYLKFEVGGIPTGVAEVGGTDEWDADCYLPLTLPGEEDDKKN